MLGASPLASTPLASEGSKIVTASGALQPVAQNLAGVVQINRQIESESALQSAAQVAYGTAQINRQIESDGALVSLPQELLGLSFINRQIESDGALASFPQALSGLAFINKQIESQGPIAAPPAAIDGEGEVFTAIQAIGALNGSKAVVNGVAIRFKQVTANGELVSTAPQVSGRQYALGYVYTTKPPVNLFLNARASTEDPANLGWVELFTTIQYKVLDPQTREYRTVNAKGILTSVVAASPTGAPAKIALSVFNMLGTSRFDIFEEYDVAATGLTKLPITRSISGGQDIYVFKSVDGVEVHLTASYALVTEEEYEAA